MNASTQQKLEFIRLAYKNGMRVCPPDSFFPGGRKILQALLYYELDRDSTVLDYGCGMLRAGYWLVPLLEPDCYFGIDPDGEKLYAGLDRILDTKDITRKRPKLTTKHGFRQPMKEWPAKFDFVLIRSVWPHMPTTFIDCCFQQFVSVAHRDSIMLASVKLGETDYDGEGYDDALHRHRFDTVERLAKQNGLSMRRAPSFLNFGFQRFFSFSLLA